MKLNLREFNKTVFLCIASVNLGITSDLFVLGIVFFALFLYLLLKHRCFYRDGFVPPYKKSIAYFAIVPCALWWVLTPSVEYGVSPFLLYIPAWYLLFLAWLQKRSLGNGGYEIFVLFNGTIALLVSLYQATRISVLFGAFALFLIVITYRRPHTALYKHFLFVLLFVFLGCASYGGFQYWKTHKSYSGKWTRDYYEKNRMMGFSPVVSLGTFSNNYKSKYNNQVVLRIWDTLSVQYLRGAVYEKYIAGIWKLPSKWERKLYPAYYNVDYAVFEIADSSTKKQDVKSVWVQATLDNFGFLFATQKSVGVACKNADSLNYYGTHIFAAENENRSDWYYFESKHLLKNDDALIDSSFLNVNDKYDSFLDSVSLSIGLNNLSITDSSLKILREIKKYFLNNFKYSLNLSNISTYKNNRQNKRDPLFAFWKAKEGYCEYYATLTTLLLRHLGIPARYITGFANPEKTPGRPFVLFRRHHSHAWVEVYINNQWIIFDPTPPMSEDLFGETKSYKSFFEGLQGYFVYVIHLLKEGEWRRVVDGWQVYLQNILESKSFYAIVAFLLFVGILWRIRYRLQNKQTNQINQKKQNLIKQLEQAEKSAYKLGYQRNPGETVNVFIKRLLLIKKNVNKKQNQEKLSAIIKLLQDYENKRWK